MKIEELKAQWDKAVSEAKLDDCEDLINLACVYMGPLLDLSTEVFKYRDHAVPSVLAALESLEADHG